MAKSFYVLDGHAQIYRAFYAPFRDLTSPSGEPTRATYVFCQTLFGLIRSRKPDFLAMALDVSDETVFRKGIDAAYKANREPAPEALHIQADRIVSIVASMGIPIFRVPGFEADDLMATIAEQLRSEDVDIYLVSKDKDLEQLITDRVRMYDVHKDEIIDSISVENLKGYLPRQAVEVQALSGDATDNIPGVAGVGTKTAAKLIRQYGSAEAVIAHADEQSPKLAERLKAFASQLPITRQLVTLRRDVPLAFTLADCARDQLNPLAARPIFAELGFTRLLETLDGFGPVPAVTPVPPAAPLVEPTERVAYQLVDTPEKFAFFFDDLSRQTTFAFDTETTGLNPVSASLVGLSFAWQSGEAYYIPVRSMFGKTLSEKDTAAALKPVFEDAAIAKIGQHAKYDMLVLRQLGIKVAGLAFDTMIAAFLLDPLRSSHSLDALTKSYTGHDMIPITDLIGKGKNQITMDQVDPGRVCEYAAEDADFTWRLAEILRPQITGSPVERLFRETEMPLVGVLMEMENNGIAIDTSLLAQLGRSMGERMDHLTDEIHRAAGHSFNIDSPLQLAKVLFDEQRLSVVRKTKTGRSTDAETLAILAEQSDHTIPKLVLEYRELAKLKGTYVDTLPKMISGRTGRIHASFHQTGAVTGRLSSSDPNLQNIPIRTEMGRRIREAFIAGAPDGLLLTADYSQIELRLLAHFCQDAALLRAFREGRDIHRAVAAEVNGVSLDQVTGEQRSAAKAVNFGIIYGQSPYGLAQSLGIPVSQAKAFIDAYFHRYPGIRAFIDRCIFDARQRGFAETILGRRRPIAELQSRNRQQVGFGERIAVNTVVQGSAADLIKRAMIDIHRELQSGGHSARMLVQVHDELVFEVPKDDVEREAAMIKHHMENAMPLKVPIIVDVAWSRHWGK